MKPYKHQIDFLTANPNKTALVWSCGTGKTRAALEWSKLSGGSTLIICPKALKTNWEREAKKWGAEVVVMTKETFRKEAKGLPKFDQVVVDEIHGGFLTPHFKSQMSKMLRGYLKVHKVERFLGLSATIFCSSPWNIYNLAHYVGYKLDYKKFDWDYFNHVRMGFRMIPVPKKGVEKKLAEVVKKFASIVDIKDVIDVPLQNHLEPEYFALTKEQEKAIKENYDPVPIVRFTLQHEIENGILIGNEFRKPQTYETDKIERIKAICEENKKVAVVCRYNDQIDLIANSLPVRPFIIRGDVKDRDKVCQEAENASEAVVIIQSDCGVGFELPSFELCIFASMSYSYTAYEQMLGRFLRMNKPSRTTFVYLLTDGDSIDQAVYNAIQDKKDFQINLYRKK